MSITTKTSKAKQTRKPLTVEQKAKRAATRKANGTAKKVKAKNNIAAKPSQSALDSARESAIPAPKVFAAYHVGYSEINAIAVQGKAEALKSAYSTAVFLETGFITLSAAGTVAAKLDSKKKPVSGNKVMLLKIAKALKHFYTATKAHPVLIDSDSRINGKGIVWLHNRLSDCGPAFNTEKALVKPFREMIRKGIDVEIKGYTVRALKARKVAA